ncbi:hypothetical protein, partial [Vibrio parahaemolyticus]
DRSHGSDQNGEFLSSDQPDQLSTETTTEITPETTSNDVEYQILGYLNLRRKAVFETFNLVVRDLRIVES